MIRVLAIFAVLLAVGLASELKYKFPYDDTICGMMSRPAGLVVGGNLTKRSQFPWMAVIAVRNKKHWVHQGSGSLITSRHVVVYVGTVSYLDDIKRWIAVTADRAVAFLGVTQRADLKMPGWIKRNVSKIVQHPDARMLLKSLSINKVAVVTLQKDVIFSEFIRPVCLWPFGDDLSEIIGRDAFAVGYGRDESGSRTMTRRHVHMTVVDEKKCEKTYSREFQSANETVLFCTMGNGHNAPCVYDDQLYMKVNSHWYLKGILTTSYVFEDGGCVTDKPSLYEDISPLVPWILEQSSSLQ